MQVEQVEQIDKIRNDFFEKIKKQEEEKQAELEKKQSNCSHIYNIRGRPDSDKYQIRRCSKCNHSAVKSSIEWRAIEKGVCTIC